MAYTIARPVCSRVQSGIQYPHDSTMLDLSTGETLIGFTAITAECSICGDRSHVEIRGWKVITNRSIIYVDNDGVVYRARMIHGFTK